MRTQALKPFLRILALCVLMGGAAATVCAEWLQTSTDHFQIIYQSDDASTAAELAELADTVYVELADYLGVDHGRRIPVVIRGEVGDANGYFTFLPTRIVLFTATPSTPIVQPNLDQWLRIVFTHELTHFLQMSQPVGWGGLSCALGRSAALVNLVLTPRFFAEGLAVTAETEFSSGGRGRSSVFEMQYVSALLAEDFWTFDQTFYGSDLAPRSRVYVGGYALVDYIVRTFGIETVNALSHEFLRHPMLGIRRAIRRTIGVDAEELYLAMIGDLESQYGDRRSLPDGNLVSPSDGGYWFLVRGTTELYGAPPAGYSGILSREAWGDGLQAPDLRNATSLSADPFSLSSDEVRIVGIRPFTDELSPSQWVGYTDLVALERESGTWRRVTHHRRLYHATVHPDGRTVIAVERVGGYSRLVRVELATGAVQAVWAPERTWMASPTVTPDGTRVALSASRDGQQDIYLVDIADRKWRQLTASVGLPELFPVFVSDTALWFTAAPGGPLTLYELDLEASRVSHLLTDRDGIFYATPVGDGAVYASYSVTGPSVKEAPRLNPFPVEWAVAEEQAPGSGGWVTDASTAPAGASDGGGLHPDLHSSRYLDWPRPDLWLPVLLPGRADGGVGLNAGAIVVAGSPLEQSMGLLVSMLNYPSWVPSVSFQLLQSRGPWQGTLAVASAPTYLDREGLRARLESTASLSLAREIARWGTVRRHSITGSIFSGITSVSTEGTMFPDLLMVTESNTLRASAGLHYSSSRERRIADMLGPAGLSVSVAGGYRAILDPVDLMPGTPALGVAGEVGVRLPAGGGMADARAALATSGYIPGIDTPRGRVAPLVGGTVPTRDPALVARIGYESPAVLMDAGRRGFNVTRFGVTATLEQVADHVNGAIQLRPETSAAVEVVLRGGYLSASFLPAAGILVTVPHADPSQVRIAITARNAAADPGIVIGR